MVDAESRPTFKELVDEFTKMSHDPGRYLVVPVCAYTFIYYLESLFIYRLRERTASTYNLISTFLDYIL